MGFWTMGGYMQRILDAWRERPEYQGIMRDLSRDRVSRISGLTELPQAALAAAIFEDIGRPLLLLTAEEKDAVALADDLRPFLGNRVIYFPVLELLPFEVFAHNIELISARVETLSRLVNGESVLIVCCLNAVSRRLIPQQLFAASQLRLKPADIIEPADLAGRLIDMGYERVSLTEIPGTFSQRGSIVDVFPMTNCRPIRIEFFDNEIDNIRYFAPDQQLSLEQVDSVLLPPAKELPLDAATRERAQVALSRELAAAMSSLRGEDKRRAEQTFAPLLEYLQQGIWDNALEMLTSYFYEDAGSIFDYLHQGLILFSEPEQIRQTAMDMKNERYSRYFDLLDQGRLLPSFYDNFLEYDDLLLSAQKHQLLLLCQINISSGDISTQSEYQLLTRELPSYAQNPANFAPEIKGFLAEGYQVFISASSELRLQRVKDILQEAGLSGITVMEAGWNSGFESPDLQIALITERELLAKEGRKRYRRTYKGGEKINNFLDLRQGDYVVHLYQGIGQYIGVERLNLGNVEKDYLLIRYAAQDKLYLPVDQLDLIQKYIGNEGNAPKLNRLGGGEWNRAKAKVKAAVQEMTEELLRLYTVRKANRGFAFSADTPWQRDFEDAFPYIETEDQLKSAEEIKADMEAEIPMDRLLCGDVGYGKTEIALRAAFKAIMDSKQVAILVPTTVLAQQHYRTIEERFAGFPVSIASLSRFSSPKEQRETVAKLIKGEIDLVVGTHRLLSKDVGFRDLGLLIIDEEQRFGVAHKEKIKMLKNQVDVLTLSATPIPRTLHMALVGMRDMSLITTPPADRHPVQTYVMEYHERSIHDAIAREMGRGGQVFFLHNQVFDIFEVAAELQRILPAARIAVAHGQMKGKELEQSMMAFVSQEVDVLVCTTIIESGLDIPNVNTLIVDNADTFGLSQLYQLRGRVGRSERQAFAYFTFKKERLINEMAKKRLIAIRDFTELGSGFKIAMRDMEMRGAGNILGPEQHGHIMAVGFDLYCKLLEEEMLKAEGKQAPAAEISTLLELEIDAYIPDSFVPDAVLKVEIYKRLAATASAAEIDDLMAELVDRYGDLPATVVNLSLLANIKFMGKRLAIASIVQNSDHILLRFAEGTPVLGETLLLLLQNWHKRLTLSDKKGFMIRLSTKGIEKDLSKVELLMKMLAELYELTTKQDDITVNKIS
jgi:transcription-repair coupling factor (superfamily II helicase)